MVVSLINGIGKTGQPHAKERNQVPILQYETKINSKWIKDLNGRPEAIQLLEDNTMGKLLDINLGNDFLDLTLKVKKTKQK